jgi:hypothetical protein
VSVEGKSAIGFVFSVAPYGLEVDTYDTYLITLGNPAGPSKARRITYPVGWSIYYYVRKSSRKDY